LTKKFEEHIGNNINEVIDNIQDKEIIGEITILIRGINHSKDQDIKNKLSEVEKKLSLNELTIPFLLNEEMKINLFLRAKNLEEFTFLRANKDLWV